MSAWLCVIVAGCCFAAAILLLAYGAFAAPIEDALVDVPDLDEPVPYLPIPPDDLMTLADAVQRDPFIDDEAARADLALWAAECGWAEK